MKAQSKLELADELRRSIKTMSHSLASCKERLADIERSCKHEWGETEQTTIDALEEVADSSRNIMRGSDIFPGFRLEKRAKRAWKRTCKLCGVSEITTKTETTYIDKPKF